MKILLIICLCHYAFGTIDRTWWHNTTLYIVLLPSFMDGDGDGFGDLKGLTSKLDYFVDLGIKTVMITPHYAAPSVKYAGYDITSYTDVNEQMGSIEDFDNLIKEMNNRGLKLIIDMVINHSGNEHPWFTKSIHREHPYTNFYIWKNAKGYDMNGNPIPPNNWLDFFGDSAWKWNPKRKQFYLHQFIEQMPDLDLRNDLVLKEFEKIFEFWSDKGVAGFRLDAADFFIEDGQYRNEPFRDPATQEIQGRPDLMNMFTLYLSESAQFIHKLRRITDRLSEKSGDFERILLPETWSKRKELYQYYGTRKHKASHLPLNYWLIQSDRYESAYYYHHIIEGYLNSLPKDAVADWCSENHDKPRRAEVFNEEYEFILTTMVLLLPGVSILYYGQELGVAGWQFEDKNIESYRLPMQWDDTKNAGFTNYSDPYRPLSPNYDQINVKKQKSEENSHYNKVKKMISWKKTDVFKFGTFKSYVLSRWVYSFTRILGDEVYLVMFNLGRNTEYVKTKRFIHNIPESMVIQIASHNSNYKTGDKIKMNEKFMLKSHATVVLHSK